MISFDDVSKAYRTRGARKAIVRDLTLTLPAGRNLGILGANGVGKSTLIRMIAGVEEPDRGRIRRDVRVSFPIGFSGGFAGSLTGRENASFLARLYNVDTPSMLRFVSDFAEIGRYFDMPYNTYSSGMKARLAFGVCMALEFDLYLIDEVIAVGDSAFQERCRAALGERMARSNVIIVSHSEETIRSFCDYTAVLANGHLRVFDTVDSGIAAHRQTLAGVA